MPPEQMLAMTFGHSVVSGVGQRESSHTLGFSPVY
jgi:hypothetical protein